MLLLVFGVFYNGEYNRSCGNLTQNLIKMDIDNFYDDNHKASQNKLIEGREYIAYSEFKRLLKMYQTEQLRLYIVSKRTSLIWKIIALFGIGYMLVDLIRYVC